MVTAAPEMPSNVKTSTLQNANAVEKTFTVQVKKR